MIDHPITNCSVIEINTEGSVVMHLGIKDLVFKSSSPRQKENVASPGRRLKRVVLSLLVMGVTCSKPIRVPSPLSLKARHLHFGGC